jgi:hypothetical protein
MPGYVLFPTGRARLPVEIHIAARAEVACFIEPD